MKDENVDKSKISAIIFAEQALSTVLINRNGEPLMRSMIWMGSRVALQAKRIIWKGLLKISGYNLFYGEIYKDYWWRP